MGTYIHGILDNEVFIDYLLEPYSDKLKHTEIDYQAYKEEQYDKLADHVRKHLNVPSCTGLCKEKQNRDRQDDKEKFNLPVNAGGF